jgi:LPXTG-motif cell wall-anchored protein
VKAAPAPAAANPAPAGDVGKETVTPAAPAAAAAKAAPRVAAEAAAPKAPATSLPHTGARDRTLVLLAGILLIAGGWAFGLGRRSALE